METKEIVKKICSLLQLSEQRYYELMFETGEEYFAFRCVGFEDALKAFRQSREMWNWWKYQYYMIDFDMIIHQQEARLGLNLNVYQAIHIGLEYFPNKAIIDKAMRDYERIVQDISKESQLVTN